MADLFEETSQAFPDLLLLTISRDGVYLCENGCDPGPWVEQTAAVLAGQLRTRRLSTAPADALARHVWNDLTSLCNVADFNVTQFDMDGHRHAIAVVQMALTQIPATMIERMTQWYGLGQLGLHPAGVTRWQSESKTVAAFYNAHEIGQVVSLGTGLISIEGERSGHERLLDEMRADLFGLLFIAREGGDWATLLDDVARYRDTAAVLQEDLKHWTRPALDALRAELTDTPDLADGADVVTMMRHADRIARAHLPGLEPLRGLHRVLLSLYNAEPYPEVYTETAALVCRLARGYSAARLTGLMAFDPARQDVLDAARRHFETLIRKASPIRQAA
ncbi:hypothetical protein CKO28_03280 [Rhodovibrio sodomensis]|uniref:Uncharacterized protein n=1 Tax=Rhodovibrio sodomensis TaxID=1088 RepID=A0ABS1DAB8_9PROT|nr:hypothetical protein [Rhodovibrio sodomensis]MBK1667067.1 hypothetical protein [Rhodovibrio sodomensis]